jgi:hypothetical protein
MRIAQCPLIGIAVNLSLISCPESISANVPSWHKTDVFLNLRDVRFRLIPDIGLFLSKGFDTELSKPSPELKVSGHDLQSSLTHTQLVTGVGFTRQLRQLCGSIHGGGDGLSLIDNAVE